MLKQICMLNFVMFATIAAQYGIVERCRIHFTFNLNSQIKKTIPALFIFTRNSNVPALKVLCASVINKHIVDQKKTLPKCIAQQVDQQQEDIMNCFRQIIQFIATQERKSKKLLESLYKTSLFDHINLKNINMLQAQVYINQKKKYTLLNLSLKRDSSAHWIPQISIKPISPDTPLQKSLEHIWHISSQGGTILTHDHTLQKKALEHKPHEGSDDEFGIEGECIIL